MRRALVLTAFDRPEYLRPALESWSRVRGLRHWHVVLSIDPSPRTAEVVRLCRAFVADAGLKDVEIVVNPVAHGVLHHPWVAMERLFAELGMDFVVRAEDDLLVTDDIVEFFDWAAASYATDSEIGIVRASSWSGGAGDAVARTDRFDPLVWGTWRDWWTALIGPTWDHDYSTATGIHDGGWDWHLNTRIMPAHGLRCIRPLASRVQNIGVRGVHSTPENFRQLPDFQNHRPPQALREVADSAPRD